MQLVIVSLFFSSKLMKNWIYLRGELLLTIPDVDLVGMKTSRSVTHSLARILITAGAKERKRNNQVQFIIFYHRE